MITIPSQSGVPVPKWIKWLTGPRRSVALARVTFPVDPVDRAEYSWHPPWRVLRARTYLYVAAHGLKPMFYVRLGGVCSQLPPALRLQPALPGLGVSRLIAEHPVVTFLLSDYREILKRASCAAAQEHRLIQEAVIKALERRQQQ